MKGMDSRRDECENLDLTFLGKKRLGSWILPPERSKLVVVPTEKEYGKTSCQGTRSYVSQSFHTKEKAKKEEELKRRKKKKKATKPISVPERKKEIEKLIAVSGAFYAFLFVSK